MSKRDAPVAIISMAQQARPKVMGHMLDSRAQLMACSSDVVMTLSSKRPSSQPMTESPDLTSRHAESSEAVNQCPGSPSVATGGPPVAGPRQAGRLSLRDA